jgi:hypothetical protein
MQCEFVPIGGDHDITWTSGHQELNPGGSLSRCIRDYW